MDPPDPQIHPAYGMEETPMNRREYASFEKIFKNSSHFQKLFV